MGAKEEEIIEVKIKMRRRDFDQLTVIAEYEGITPPAVLRGLIRDRIKTHAEAELKEQHRKGKQANG